MKLLKKKIIFEKSGLKILKKFLCAIIFSLFDLFVPYLLDLIKNKNTNSLDIKFTEII